MKHRRCVIEIKFDEGYMYRETDDVYICGVCGNSIVNKKGGIEPEYCIYLDDVYSKLMSNERVNICSDECLVHLLGYFDEVGDSLKNEDMYISNDKFSIVFHSDRVDMFRRLQKVIKGGGSTSKEV